MTRAKRVDDNQAEIVDALQDIGCSVQNLSGVGGGCPDLALGYQGKTYLVEIKSPTGKLNSRQQRWHAEWRGQVAVCWTLIDVLRAIEYLQDRSEE